MHGHGYLSGEFTLEAALLMGLILPMLTALILAGFYVHDRGYLQGAACEVAAMGSTLQQYEEREGALRQRQEGRLRHALTWSRALTGSVSAGEDEIRVELSGSFPIPGLAARFLTGGSLSLRGSWERQLYHPAKLIRKARGAKKLMDLVLEE